MTMYKVTTALHRYSVHMRLCAVHANSEIERGVNYTSRDDTMRDRIRREDSGSGRVADGLRTPSEFDRERTVRNEGRGWLRGEICQRSGTGIERVKSGGRARTRERRKEGTTNGYVIKRHEYIDKSEKE